MSVGLPVIASDVGGVRECVVDNSNGFLLDSNDPLRLTQLIKAFIDLSDNDKNRFGYNSRLLYEKKFTFDRLITSYKDLPLRILIGSSC